MKVMILSAGLGIRLRPFTNTMPKSLVPLQGRPLIEHLFHNLDQAGFTEVIVNLHCHARQLQTYIDSLSFKNLTICTSLEYPDILETGGGVFQALSWLGEDPFLLINGDIFTDFPFGKLQSCSPELAHLILVLKPPYLAKGDFMVENGLVQFSPTPPYTFSGISVIHPRLFTNCLPGFFRITTPLFQAIHQQQVTGELFEGKWIVVDTPAALTLANECLL